MNQVNTLYKKMIEIVAFHLRLQNCKVYFRAHVPQKGAVGLYEDRKCYVDKDQPLPLQYFTLIHERRHFICHTHHCFCFKQVSDFWTEYHAFSDEMFELLDLIPLYKIFILYESYAKECQELKWLSHLLAIRKIFRWRRIRDIATKKHMLRKYNHLLKIYDDAIEQVRPFRDSRR